MNRKTRLLQHMLFTLGLGASVAFTSCNDNDLANGGGSGNNGDDSSETEQLDKREALSLLLGALADVDTVPTAWSTYTTQPTVGVVKDASEPHVRYLVVPDAAEAYRTYCSYVGASCTEGEAKNAEWTVDSIGSLKFEVKNQTDLYASLKVDVKQLPSLEELRFVPASALGDNGFTPDGMYYQFGDVVLQKKDGKQTYWVCVRPCSKSSSLRKTHWATLQLADDNFKKINDNLTLPTKLSVKKDEGARMVQNFFNVLRIAENGSLYDETVGLDKVRDKTEFSNDNAKALYHLWDMQEVWPDLPNSQYPGFRNDFKNMRSLSAFYYGYSSVWLGKGDYRVYQLDLSQSEKSKGLFDTATPSTPYLKKQHEEGYKSDFTVFQGPQASGCYIDSYDRDEFTNYFIVKTQTSSELLGKKADVDPASDKSLSAQKGEGGVKIIDVVISRQYPKLPFYLVGDEVSTSSASQNKQLCFYSTFEHYFNNVSFFLCSGDNPAFTAKTISEKLAVRMLYQFLWAYKYVVLNEDNKELLDREVFTVNGQEKAKLNDAAKDAYRAFLKNLYNNYLNGKIVVVKNINDNDNPLTLTANLNGVYWQLTREKDATTGDYEYVATQVDNNDLPQLYIAGYQELMNFTQDFTPNYSNISFVTRGMDNRNLLRYGMEGEFYTKFKENNIEQEDYQNFLTRK